MWIWVYSRGHPFYPILLPGVLDFSTDGELVDGYLAVLPRLKGRKNISLFFLFDSLMASIITSYRVRLFLSNAVDWNCFHMPINFVFVYSVRLKSLQSLICRTTADQACFCTSHLCLRVNNWIRKIFEPSNCNWKCLWTRGTSWHLLVTYGPFGRLFGVASKVNLRHVTDYWMSTHKFWLPFCASFTVAVRRPLS
jgi:hypothetical protein